MYVCEIINGNVNLQCYSTCCKILQSNVVHKNFAKSTWIADFAIINFDKTLIIKFCKIC